MSKYQEALDKIKYLIDEFLTQGYEVVGFHLNSATEPLENFIVDNIDDDDLEILQEAIDKANKYDERETPSKPRVNDEKDLYYIYYCGNCGCTLEVKRDKSDKDRWRFCRLCGKEVDWSEEK